MSTYVAIVGCEPAEVLTSEQLGVVFHERGPEKPEDYVTLYEQRESGIELRGLELRTHEVSRDEAFRYLRTELRDPRAANDHGAALRGNIDWDVKL